MPVTVTVDAPESITQERLFEWLRDLGINPYDGISRILIERGGITIYLNARRPDGKLFAVGSEDLRVAENTVVIPVIEP